MTLTGDTGYHTEINATYDPPFMGMKESQTMLDGKYVGPCRDGLVPGDFITPERPEVQHEGHRVDEGRRRRPPNPHRPAKVPQ